MLVELIERMQQADKMIREMAEIETNDLEAARLHGKASGVGLCMGYFREALSAHRGAV